MAIATRCDRVLDFWKARVLTLALWPTTESPEQAQQGLSAFWLFRAWRRRQQKRSCLPLNTAFSHGSVAAESPEQILKCRALWLLSESSLDATWRSPGWAPGVELGSYELAGRGGRRAQVRRRLRTT